MGSTSELKHEDTHLETCLVVIRFAAYFFVWSAGAIYILCIYNLLTLRFTEMTGIRFGYVDSNFTESVH